MNDRLDRLFSLQGQLMELLNVELEDEYTKSFAFYKIVSAIGSEVTEVLDALNTFTKPWKQGSSEEELKAKLREEVVDILFMFIETCILMDLSAEDVESEYRKKFRKNLQRFLLTKPPQNDADTAARLLSAMSKEDEIKIY